jgi:hypothetical protein|tara:strand:- start:92 stop:277 length:186 start_codon:yes stop_codon:yes gene_type:complete
MKINLWYSKGMKQWRWTLSEEFRNGVTKLEQHSGQRIYLRDAMDDVANTVEYILDHKDETS